MSIVEKIINKEICLNSESFIVEKKYKDINYKLVILTSLDLMEINIKVYANGNKDNCIEITRNFIIDKNGVSLDINLSNQKYNIYEEKFPQVSNEKLTHVELLFNNDDSSDSEIIYKVEEGYSFDYISMNNPELDGYLIDDKTIIVDSFEDFENKTFELKENIKDFETKAKTELFLRLSNSWDEVEEKYYEYIWNEIKNDKNFIILLIRENFDLSDTAPREELDSIITNNNIDTYDLEDCLD